MINNISDRFTEVYSILKCLDEKDREKIPQKVLKEIENKKNNSYQYQYIPGDEQYLDDYTIAILNQIYFKYLKIKNV